MRVLIIDDNADSTLALRMLLELEGHEVEVAHDGRSGLEACARSLPEVVLCDLVLPDMHGTDVGRALPSGARKIAVTGHDPADVRAACESAGFALVMQKPLDLDALLQGMSPA
ncbi:MAG: response regulator [Myxococcota bacterium]